MRSVMVRYTTTPDHAEANASRIRAVFDALRASAPTSFRYSTFRLPDGDSFMHVATMDSASANPLTSLPEFDAFQRELRDDASRRPSSPSSPSSTATSPPPETSPELEIA